MRNPPRCSCLGNSPQHMGFQGPALKSESWETWVPNSASAHLSFLGLIKLNKSSCWVVFQKHN